MRIAKVCAVAALAALTGCYHYTVVTGAPESDKKIDVRWQKSWVFGLVPPDTIKSKATCAQGVAKVETQHTFLNGLVRLLTYSIFTPINPVVTCASGPVGR
ncbi:MAG: Bor family protein [Gemmatimonadaceae bacterium]|jgi:hypothetical protein|nr:Bor family protein [Gemmatimonadaceae bacterium]